jgi:hypothetical protein
MNTSRTMLLCLGLLFLLSSCFRSKDDEVILFVRLAAPPRGSFGNGVDTISPNGGSIRNVLPIGKDMACELISARSLDGPAILYAWQAVGNDASPHLFECRFGSTKCRRIFPETNNSESEGVIGPDNRSLAAVMAPTGRREFALYIGDLDGTAHQVSYPPENSSDRSPVWSPDGKEILFVRVILSAPSFVTKLMKVDLETRAESTVADGILAASYSPNGKEVGLWSKNGLEVLDRATGKRTVILPRTDLPGRSYQVGSGLGWSREDTLMIPLSNTRTKKYELLKISRDGHVKTIYSSQYIIQSVSIVPRTVAQR